MRHNVMQQGGYMTARELVELELRVNALDRDHARRVARLVLECRAPLKDALTAVEMADTMSQVRRAPQQPRRWLRVRAVGE
jgi:hypothetical protein